VDTAVYAMGDADDARYGAIFDTLALDHDGFVTHHQAIELYAKSGLALQVRHA
jgi:hypothetical protein